MSIKSKRKSREKKGPATTYVDDKIIQGDDRGDYRKKPVRENVLKDVLELREQGKTKAEIHDFGCGKYFFRDDNPWEDRYFTYIEEKGL